MSPADVVASVLVGLAGAGLGVDAWRRWKHGDLLGRHWVVPASLVLILIAVTVLVLFP